MYTFSSFLFFFGEIIMVFGIWTLMVPQRIYSFGISSSKCIFPLGIFIIHCCSFSLVFSFWPISVIFISLPYLRHQTSIIWSMAITLVILVVSYEPRTLLGSMSMRRVQISVVKSRSTQWDDDKNMAFHIFTLSSESTFIVFILPAGFAFPSLGLAIVRFSTSSL